MLIVFLKGFKVLREKQKFNSIPPKSFFSLFMKVLTKVGFGVKRTKLNFPVHILFGYCKSVTFTRYKAKQKNAIRKNLTRPLDLFIANILILILFNPKHIFAIKAFTFFSFLDSP